MTSTRSSDAGRRVGCAAIALLALLAGAGIADAQKDDNLKQRAERHFNQGRRHIDRGEFDKAAGEYEKAYELFPHPELLYHLGQAHRQAGKLEQALEHYRKYLLIAPTGRAAVRTRRYIEEIETELAKRAAATTGDPPAAETTDRPAPPSPPAVERNDTADDPVRLDSPTDEPAAPGRVYRIAGLATGGLGVALLGVSVWFGLDARSLDNDLSEPRAEWTDADLNRIRSGERAERRAVIASIVGGLAIGGGVALYAIGWRKGRQPDDAVAYSISPDESLGGVTIFASGRF